MTYLEPKPFKPLNPLPEVKCNPGGEPYIECNKCQKVMMVLHACYGRKLEHERHILDGKDVCHWCWDNMLNEAVSASGL